METLIQDKPDKLDKLDKPANQDGGFWGGKKSFDGTIKKTKSSESKLITEYTKMDKAAKQYQTAYKNHLANLETLDDYANFKGMEELFQRVIMKEHLKKNGDVDKKSPILLRNYFIEKGITPSEFRKEHIMQQIEYILENQFPGKDQMFIKTKEIELGKYEFILYITTIENIKKSRKISHKNYVVDFGEARAALKDIIGTTKKNLKRVSSILEMSERESSRGSSRRGSSHSKGSDVSKLKSGSRKKTRKTGSGSGNKEDKEDNGAAGLMIDLLGDNSMGKSSRRAGSKKSKSKTKKSLDLFKTPSEIRKAKEPTKATAAVGAAAGMQAMIPVQMSPGMGQVPADLTMRKEQLAAAPPGGVAPAGDKAAICAAIPNPSIGSCKAAGCAWFDNVGNKCLPERPPRPPQGYQPQGYQPRGMQATQPGPRPNMDFGAPMQAPQPAAQNGLGF